MGVKRQFPTREVDATGMLLAVSMVTEARSAWVFPFHSPSSWPFAKPFAPTSNRPSPSTVIGETTANAQPTDWSPAEVSTIPPVKSRIGTAVALPAGAKRRASRAQNGVDRLRTQVLPITGSRGGKPHATAEFPEDPAW